MKVPYRWGSFKEYRACPKTYPAPPTPTPDDNDTTPIPPTPTPTNNYGAGVIPSPVKPTL